MPDPKYKVLVVDDDQFLLNMYGVKFKKAGLDVNTALSGAAAISILREGYDPDILILDIVMPAMDGIELLNEIRKQKLAVRAVVIVLSNQGERSDIEKVKKLGVEGYIVKASTIPSEVLSEIMKIAKAHKG